MSRNEDFWTWNLILLQIYLKYMFNQTAKIQPVHVIIVHKSKNILKELVLFFWLASTSFHLNLFLNFKFACQMYSIITLTCFSYMQSSINNPTF